MAYASWSVVFGEQPSAAKWNILGTNDAYFDTSITTIFSAWSTWTPTWTNLTIGNGTNTCRYIQMGKTVFFHLQTIAGTTSSSTGVPIFTLPVAVNSTTFRIVGTGNADNAWVGHGAVVNSATSSYPIWGRLYDADEILLTVGNAASTYANHTSMDMDASAVPFQWATGDVVYYWGFYESV